MQTTITRDHSIQSQMDLIMENFNWDAVMRVFKTEQLKYCAFDADAKDFIEYSPSLEDVQSVVKELFESSVKDIKKNATWSSGLFNVEWNAYDETLKLQFIPYELEIAHDEPNETIFVV
jgi:hypothetical protein